MTELLLIARVAMLVDVEGGVSMAFWLCCWDMVGEGEEPPVVRGSSDCNGDWTRPEDDGGLENAPGTLGML